MWRHVGGSLLDRSPIPALSFRRAILRILLTSQLNNKMKKTQSIALNDAVVST